MEAGSLTANLLAFWVEIEDARYWLSLAQEICQHGYSNIRSAAEGIYLTSFDKTVSGVVVVILVPWVVDLDVPMAARGKEFGTYRAGIHVLEESVREMLDDPIELGWVYIVVDPCQVPRPNDSEMQCT